MNSMLSWHDSRGLYEAGQANPVHGCMAQHNLVMLRRVPLRCPDTALWVHVRPKERGKAAGGLCAYVGGATSYPSCGLHCLLLFDSFATAPSMGQSAWKSGQLSARVQKSWQPRHGSDQPQQRKLSDECEIVLTLHYAHCLKSFIFEPRTTESRKTADRQGKSPSSCLIEVSYAKCECHLALNSLEKTGICYSGPREHSRRLE